VQVKGRQANCRLCAFSWAPWPRRWVTWVVAELYPCRKQQQRPIDFARSVNCDKEPESREQVAGGAGTAQGGYWDVEVELRAQLPEWSCQGETGRLRRGDESAAAA